MLRGDDGEEWAEAGGAEGEGSEEDDDDASDDLRRALRSLRARGGAGGADMCGYLAACGDDAPGCERLVAAAGARGLGAALQAAADRGLLPQALADKAAAAAAAAGHRELARACLETPPAPGKVPGPGAALKRAPSAKPAPVIVPSASPAPPAPAPASPPPNKGLFGRSSSRALASPAPPTPDANGAASPFAAVAATGKPERAASSPKRGFFGRGGSARGTPAPASPSAAGAGVAPAAALPAAATGAPSPAPSAALSPAPSSKSAAAAARRRLLEALWAGDAVAASAEMDAGAALPRHPDFLTAALRANNIPGVTAFIPLHRGSAAEALVAAAKFGRADMLTAVLAADPPAMQPLALKLALQNATHHGWLEAIQVLKSALAAAPAPAPRPPQGAFARLRGALLGRSSSKQPPGSAASMDGAAGVASAATAAAAPEAVAPTTPLPPASTAHKAAAAAPKAR